VHPAELGRLQGLARLKHGTLQVLTNSQAAWAGRDGLSSRPTWITLGRCAAPETAPSLLAGRRIALELRGRRSRAGHLDEMVIQGGLEPWVTARWATGPDQALAFP